MMPRLRPCPDCGGVPHLWSDVDAYAQHVVTPYLYVSCDSCGLTGPIRLSEHAAILAWNKMVERSE